MARRFSNPMSPPEEQDPALSRLDPFPGRVIAGNFRIGSLIGSGAMGNVYKAEQLSLGKAVAAGTPWTVLGFWNAGGGVAIAGPATYDSCFAAPGYSSDNISLTALRRAKTVCVKTDQGRTTALTIKSVSETQLSFDVTTFTKDGD